jgi:hypothetical protein
MKSFLFLLPLLLAGCKPQASTTIGSAHATAQPAHSPATQEPQLLRDIPQIRASARFHEFLSHFLLTAVSSQNFDSLNAGTSPLVHTYTDARLGLQRFASIGIYCKPLAYESFGGRLGTTLPDISGLPVFFSDELPRDGFCEESESPDGVYFRTVTALPEDIDAETGMRLPADAHLLSLPLRQVVVLHEHWYLKTFYFAQEKGEWYLVVVQDCGCEA